MYWRLWLDDQWMEKDMPFRNPPEDFIPAANVEQAKSIIDCFGNLPIFIDFDHDLGDGLDAPALIHWMADAYPNDPIPAYNVHSANPVGRKNIESLMGSWKKSKEI